MALFIGVLLWAFGKKRKKHFEKDAKIPFKVARWGAGSAHSEGDPVWDVVEQYLKSDLIVKHHTPNVPRLIGLGLSPGFAND